MVRAHMKCPLMSNPVFILTSGTVRPCHNSLNAAIVPEQLCVSKGICLLDPVLCSYFPGDVRQLLYPVVQEETSRGAAEGSEK